MKKIALLVACCSMMVVNAAPAPEIRDKSLDDIRDLVDDYVDALVGEEGKPVIHCHVHVHKDGTKHSHCHGHGQGEVTDHKHEHDKEMTEEDIESFIHPYPDDTNLDDMIELPTAEDGKPVVHCHEHTHEDGTKHSHCHEHVGGDVTDHKHQHDTENAQAASGKDGKPVMHCPEHAEGDVTDHKHEHETDQEGSNPDDQEDLSFAAEEEKPVIHCHVHVHRDGTKHSHCHEHAAGDLVDHEHEREITEEDIVRFIHPEIDGPDPDLVDEY